MLTLDDTIDTVTVNTYVNKSRQRSSVQRYGDRSMFPKGKRFVDLSIPMNNIKERGKEIIVRILHLLSLAAFLLNGSRNV